mmetsp:Transcript_41930/g.121302  ORF Transcript_41930/g.121302 Transcript_41930/m.121302 type:complete len:210 (+) Transcript_41930:1359-1988(+)
MRSCKTRMAFSICSLSFGSCPAWPPGLCALVFFGAFAGRAAASARPGLEDPSSMELAGSAFRFRSWSSARSARARLEASLQPQLLLSSAAAVPPCTAPDAGTAAAPRSPLVDLVRGPSAGVDLEAVGAPALGLEAASHCCQLGGRPSAAPRSLPSSLSWLGGACSGAGVAFFCCLSSRSADQSFRSCGLRMPWAGSSRPARSSSSTCFT